MYLRSVRLKPSARSALIVALNVSIAPAGTSTSETTTWQSGVVTYRRCRTPPVSFALAL
jgi:hypothetical protein